MIFYYYRLLCHICVASLSHKDAQTKATLCPLCVGVAMSESVSVRLWPFTFTFTPCLTALKNVKSRKNVASLDGPTKKENLLREPREEAEVRRQMNEQR